MVVVVVEEERDREAGTQEESSHRHPITHTRLHSPYVNNKRTRTYLRPRVHRVEERAGPRVPELDGAVQRPAPRGQQAAVCFGRGIGGGIWMRV